MLVPVASGPGTPNEAWVPGLQADEAVVGVNPDALVAAAFNEVGASLRAMVLKTTHDPELAADATQEAFTRLLREARAGRYPTHPRAWLYRTATNVAVSRHRQTAVAQRWAPRLVRLDPPTPPESIVIERERSGLLRDAVARLMPSERTALVMAASGASGEEIAAHLGRSHGATRSLMHRARARLRRELVDVDAA